MATFAPDGNSINPDKIWIYHERQQASLCGQHALNNLAQSSDAFTANGLADIAQQLDALELQLIAQQNSEGIRSHDYQRRLMEGSHHVDAQGNFSIEVLKVALQNKYGIQLPHLSQKDLLSNTEITDFQGFLVHKADHWFAIRNIGGRFWNLNSTIERPVVISHFKLATEMQMWQKQGYTIFCIPSGLPNACVKPSKGHTNATKTNWWHKMSDLLHGKSTNRDPWENVGSGIRLDGRSTSSSIPMSNSSSSNNNHDFDDLTEEEQLQLALQFSMEPSAVVTASAMTRTVTDSSSSCTDFAYIHVPPEPDNTTPGVVKIQFRLPDGGKSIVRRFLQTDIIDIVYAFVYQQSSSSSNRKIELRYGFPPKDLSIHLGKTIQDTKLANECIQCRYL